MYLPALVPCTTMEPRTNSPEAGRATSNPKQGATGINSIWALTGCRDLGRELLGAHQDGTGIELAAERSLDKVEWLTV